MIKKIGCYLRDFFESAVPVLKRYPVEMGLMVCSLLTIILVYEEIYPEWVGVSLLPIPVILSIAYVLNKLTQGTTMRYLYYASWLPGFVLWLMRVSALWADKWEFWVTIGVLCPLMIVTYRRIMDNRAFVGNALSYVLSALISSFFAWVVAGLFLAVFFSIVYIFHIMEGWGSSVCFYSCAITGLLLQPICFFILLDRMQEQQLAGGKLLDVLLNWIFTPALIIYAAILNLYALKVVVTWTLPEGNVAFMVFGFTVLALLVKALRLIVAGQRFEWFFTRFSLIALPSQVLFWVGTMYRVGQYGLTEVRVWLLVFGMLMTLSVVLFLTQRFGRYLYCCAIAFAVVAAVTYIPVLKPNKIALHSQQMRVERFAAELGLIGEGKDTLSRIEKVDTVDYQRYRNLYESAMFLYYRDDTVALKRILRVANPEQLLEQLPFETAFFARHGEYSNNKKICDPYIYLSNDYPDSLDISGYKNFYDESITTNQLFFIENDTLVLRLPDKPEWRMAGSVFVDHQLSKVGYSGHAWPNRDILEANKTRILRYEDEHRLIIFRNMGLMIPDEQGLTVNDAVLMFVLTK